MTRIAIRGLSVSAGRKRILDGIDLDFRPGALTGLIGPNGAGKTTLLRSILGVTRTTAGTVHIDDRQRSDWKPSALAKRIGFLPQGAPVHWPMTVERLVALGRLPHFTHWRGMSKEDTNAIEQAMAQTDVAHLRGRVATTLSGGEQALAMIARCIAGGAPVLLVDEPVAGLDPAHCLQVMETLKATVSRTSGVVAVLHDLSLAARFCDRIVMMQAGRVVADGSPEAVLTQDALRDVYGIEVVSGIDDRVPYVLAKARCQRPAEP